VLRAYRWLLLLYPIHVRALYGSEMCADFAPRLLAAQSAGRARSLVVILREVLQLVPDAVAERIAALSSHPSFHGRRPPNLAVVRPPNVGKHEWFNQSPVGSGGEPPAA
jgi:hypothetical protein